MTRQDRLEAQRANLAVQGVIARLPRAEHRVRLILGHLADRWGLVTGAGTMLSLPMSHDLLAQLAGARRSTITLAVGALERDGAISRTADGSWLLTAAAEAWVQAISRTPAPGPTLGETLGLRLRTSATRENALAVRAEARLSRVARAASARQAAAISSERRRRPDRDYRRSSAIGR